MMPDNDFLDLRAQLAAALLKPITTAEARIRVQLCFVDVGQAASLRDLLHPDLAATLQNPFGIDDVADLEGVVITLRKRHGDNPDVKARLPVLSFWIALLGGPAAQWQLGRYVAALASHCADKLEQHAACSNTELAVNLERAWTEHENQVDVQAQANDGAEAFVVATCNKAAASFLVFQEAERLLDPPCCDTFEFLQRCKLADQSQRSWEDLLDSVCRLPARTPRGRYAKNRLASLLGKLEPSGSRAGALERLFESSRHDHSQFGLG